MKRWRLTQCRQTFHVQWKWSDVRWCEKNSPSETIHHKSHCLSEKTILTLIDQWSNSVCTSSMHHCESFSVELRVIFLIDDTWYWTLEFLITKHMVSSYSFSMVLPHKTEMHLSLNIHTDQDSGLHFSKTEALRRARLPPRNRLAASSSDSVQTCTCSLKRGKLFELNTGQRWGWGWANERIRL